MSGDRAFPERPIIGIGVVVIRGLDVLLIRRPDLIGIGEWSIPGGAQEAGETARQAAARELFEETGVTADIGALLDVVDLIGGNPARPEIHYTLIDYLGIWQAGEPQAASDALDARFIPLARLEDYPMWSETRRIIEMAARTAHGARP